MKKILTALSVVTLLTACGQSDKPQNPELLRGGQFATTQDGVPVTIGFDATENMVYGKVVNNYRGPYTAKGNEIVFGPVASTMMMGLPGAMTVEHDYHTFMGNVRNYELSDTTLTFTDKDGNTMTFERVAQ